MTSIPALVLKRVQKKNSKRFDSYTIRSKSPAGTLYLHFLESDGELIQVMCSAGKCGSEFNIFVNGICSLINEMLDNNMSISNIVSALSGMHTDKSTRDGDIDVRSGVGGVHNALMKYIRAKSRELKVKDYDQRMDERGIA